MPNKKKKNQKWLRISISSWNLEIDVKVKLGVTELFKGLWTNSESGWNVQNIFNISYTML